MTNKIIVGTRDSKLALTQTQKVTQKLNSLHPHIQFEVLNIKTKGDILQDHPIESSIDKGFFVKEIQEMLLKKKIDIAIHSLKDLPVDPINGLEVSAVLERDDSRDALVLNPKIKFNHDLNHLTISTSSNRRKSQLLKLYPEIKMKTIRGNVDTRIEKMEQGYCDGIIISAAALIRLGLQDRITYLFDNKEMICAPGQGTIAIESREEDKEIKKIVNSINHNKTSVCVEIERSFLKTLEGGCTAPIGAYAQIVDDKVLLKGIISSLNGKKHITNHITSKYNNSGKLGIKLAKQMLLDGGDEILSEVRG
jgi:hydroxymethylbilane synthase